MLFQGPLVLKFSCDSGANNQPHLFRRLETRCIIVTSETILNIAQVARCIDVLSSYVICILCM